MSPKARIRRPSPSMVVALGALVLAGGGVAAASVPAGDGTISGCYAKNSGGLRVIDVGAGAKCTSSEKALAWSQTGPQGAPGVKGDTGATGPAGAFGSVITRAADLNMADGDTGSKDAICLSTELAVGGGGGLFGGDPGSSSITENEPGTADRDANGNPLGVFSPLETNGGVNSADAWQVTATNKSGGVRDLAVFVLCVPRPH